MTWKTIGFAVALAATAAVVVPQPAEALPPNEVWRYYFSDATFSDEVGSRFVTSCYGVEHIMTGVTSPYVLSTSESCSDQEVYTYACYDHGSLVPCP